MKLKKKHLYGFGPFQLDVVEKVLFREGQPVPLTPRVYEVLMLLVQNGDHVVTKEDLMLEVWRDSFVEDGNLTQSISVLRKTLGEKPGAPQYIETIPRRGY